MQSPKAIPALFLAAFLAPVAPAQSPPPSAPVTSLEEPVAAKPLFERVVVLGASVSDGYGLQQELKADVKLGQVLDCMLVGERAASVDLGDIWFFQQPERKGTKMVEAALRAEPSLVVGVDFLFWFGYSSSWVRGKDRLKHLELGLSLLERFDCPLIVGDFPDMSIALDGVGPFGGPLIAEHMIPSEEERAALNERVHAWAEERGDTVVVPMADFLRRATKRETISVRGNTWEGGALGTLLQEDLLHPRADGVISLAVIMLDRLVEAREDLDADDVRWKSAEIRERLMEATRAEREKTIERDRRREERRKRREERDGGGGE